jgi:SAM-dependent methyltransferase
MKQTVRAPVPLLELNGDLGLRFFFYLLETNEVENGRELAKIARQTLVHLADPKQERAASQPLEELQVRWYRALASGSPDWSVYAAPEYLAEAWACWSFYSRKYLRHIRDRKSLPPWGIAGRIEDGAKIVDLGCGIGMTTAALTELYPRAQVIGTNLPDTLQTKIAKGLGRAYGFQVVDGTAAIRGATSLVFASEYFEHFEAPIDHLREVLRDLRPKRLIIANTFNAKSTGHFDRYSVDGSFVDGPTTSRLFGRELRASGYQRLEANLWNNRPAVWDLIET